MKKFLIYLFFILLPFLSHATIQIVVIGDSISTNQFCKQDETYFSVLEKSLKESYDVKVMTFGVGGMCSGGGFSILDGLYKSFDKDVFNPTIAIVSIGINDFGSSFPTGDTYKALEFFIQLCIKHECIPIIGKLDVSYLYNPSNTERIIQFNKVFTDLENKYHVLTFPFLTPDLVNDPSTHVGDKIHLTAKGHKIVSQHLEQLIVPILTSFNKRKERE